MVGIPAPVLQRQDRLVTVPLQLIEALADQREKRRIGRAQTAVRTVLGRGADTIECLRQAGLGACTKTKHRRCLTGLGVREAIAEPRLQLCSVYLLRLGGKILLKVSIDALY